MYLITCSEAYLEKHPKDGYDPSKSDTNNLTWLRSSLDQQDLKHDRASGRSRHVRPCLLPILCIDSVAGLPTKDIIKVS